ncbi:type III pantothenate kinase [Anaerococcus cruorum]|uniref:type III pantothenate kinase n=1 Tax=Anaerococcus sp. WGS1596 TaxID=3366806 RepID=UPI00372D7BAC
MLLAIDIENKFTKFGVFDKENLLETFSLVSDKNKSIDEIEVFIKLIFKDKNIAIDAIEQIIISSVVPELSKIYEKISKNITGKNPILISAGVKTGLNIKCENPKDVGSDRIIRAVGAKEFDDNLIIISASSITTIDFINNKNEFRGGVIFPGIDLYAKSLYQESAKLPQVEIEKTKEVLGNNTKNAMQSGIYHSYNFAITGMVEKIIDQYFLDINNLSIIITGSHANLIENNKYDFKNIPNLGLYGLKNIFEINKEKLQK